MSKHKYGWIPDSDDPTNESIRALLLKAKARKKVRSSKKKKSTKK